MSAEDLVEAETLSVRLEAAVRDDLRDEAPYEPTPEALTPSEPDRGLFESPPVARPAERPATRPTEQRYKSAQHSDLRRRVAS